MINETKRMKRKEKKPPKCEHIFVCLIFPPADTNAMVVCVMNSDNDGRLLSICFSNTHTHTYTSSEKKQTMKLETIQ